MSKYSKPQKVYTNNINNKKLALITVASILALFLIVGSVVCFIWLMSADSKIPATTEEVKAAIINSDYEPIDYTVSYY